MFLLASITKPMTAAAVMTLVDAGQLSLDDKVVKFFPAFTGDGRETITLRNLPDPYRRAARHAGR